MWVTHKMIATTNSETSTALWQIVYMWVVYDIYGRVYIFISLSLGSWWVSTNARTSHIYLGRLPERLWSRSYELRLMCMRYIFTSSWYRARIDRSQGDFLVSWSSTLEIGLTIYDGWMACVGGGGVVCCATDHRYNCWQRRSSGDIVFDPLIKSSRVSAMALRGVPLRFGCGQYQ